ncbi:heavy metal translocating P-type ATPase [Anaerocolumna cellulosilytica]|uniref:Cd(2+)-exporting ATPase n=2 Tax=Anaerocolumna cellulosilytica TaxID=433286 RepID=A0A6S6R1F7_9FIRM|nr:heavy metal translocating P-type ATPase [Anaerocolumna cellulosilytica]
MVTILSLAVSLLSLLCSFFKLIRLPVDIAWIAIILCGLPIIKEAVIGLVTEFDIKADVLVSLALIASAIIGEIFAAGEVAFIMTLGALLEERTVAKARQGIERLIHLTPRTGRVLKDAREEIIPAEEIVVGDILRVLPGETIAIDGIVMKGETSVDQAVMTGESMPVDKKEGDEVFSGTVNQFGTIEIEAVKIGEDSSLQRMIRLVESADAGKAKIVGIADRWATWIVVIALISAGITWFISGEIIRAVTILVVFCPCALVLATPTAIMAGIGNAAKVGILIREGDALERLAKISRITFDKTGTLTQGKPVVTYVHSFQDNITASEILQIAASIEQYSEHPLGKAVVENYKLQIANKQELERKAVNSVLYDISDFKMFLGKGVVGKLKDDSVYAGNLELIMNYFPESIQELTEKAKIYYQKGSTVIFVGLADKIIGFLVLEDVLRKDAREVVEGIRQQGIACVLLTGDYKMAAEHIGKEAGIEEIVAECLPEDKLTYISRHQEKGQQVCMIGDGINDAPALKKSYVGIAMGGIGSDIAVDAADMALVSDEIKYLPHLLSLAKRTMKTIYINLALSMLLNLAAILLAMTGILNPILGALVHNVGSVVVIIHSSLLLAWKNQ